MSTTTASGLIYEELIVGEGEEAARPERMRHGAEKRFAISDIDENISSEDEVVASGALRRQSLTPYESAP